MCRALSNKFGVVQAHRTSSNPHITHAWHDIRERKVCRALSNKFGVVQAHRTSSNPHITHAWHDIRERKVCRDYHSVGVTIDTTALDQLPLWTSSQSFVPVAAPYYYDHINVHAISVKSLARSARPSGVSGVQVCPYQ